MKENQRHMVSQKPRKESVSGIQEQSVVACAPERSSKVRPEKHPLNLVIRWSWTTLVSAVTAESKAT